MNKNETDNFVNAVYDIVKSSDRKNYVLKGRGHDARCTVRSHISKRLALIVGLQSEILCPGKASGPRSVYSLEIIIAASESAGVSASEIIGKTY